MILEGCCFKGCEKNNVSVVYLYLENPINNLIFTFNEIDADFMHYILNHDNNEKNPERTIETGHLVLERTHGIHQRMVARF